MKLLLSYGADPNLKNQWGYTPADETNVEEIKKLVLEYKEAEFARSYINKGLATNICNIIDKQTRTEIGRKIVRNHEAIQSMTKQEWDDRLASWDSCRHGTKSQYLESILRHGLVPSGENAGDFTTPSSGTFNWDDVVSRKITGRVPFSYPLAFSMLPTLVMLSY